MIACIADASVIVKTVVDEAGSEAVERFLRANPAAAPTIAHIECTNVLRRLVKAQVLTRARAFETLNLLIARVQAIPETPQHIVDTFELALELDHAAQDCVYLAVARARRLPLVTADAVFARKARRKGHAVEVL